MEGNTCLLVSPTHTFIRQLPYDSLAPEGFHLALVETSASLKGPFLRGHPQKHLGGASRVPRTSSNIYDSTPSSTPELHLKSHQLHHDHLKMASGALNTYVRVGAGTSICAKMIHHLLFKKEKRRGSGYSCLQVVAVRNRISSQNDKKVTAGLSNVMLFKLFINGVTCL